jgi:predicted GNAT family acetyltransferase
MSLAAAKLEVRHNRAFQRFETTVDGELARADYRMDGDVMRMVHTEVPPGSEGRGIAGALVRAALEYARASGLTVLPRCSYVRAYMRRHPETRSLLAVESPT